MSEPKRNRSSFSLKKEQDSTSSGEANDLSETRQHRKAYSVSEESEEIVCTPTVFLDYFDYQLNSVVLKHIQTSFPLRTDVNVSAQNTFSPLNGATIKVRTKTYLKTRIKQFSTANGLNFYGIDLIRSQNKILHIASYPNSPIAKIVNEVDAFTLVVNFIIPCDDHQLHFIILSSIPKDFGGRLEQQTAELLKLFLKCDQQFCTDHLKFMATCSGGPWIVRKTVGAVPCILAHKIKTYFYRGKNYFEICCDVNSTSAGSKVFKKIKNAFSSLVINLAFWLEGKESQYLPEQVLTGLTIAHVNFADLDRTCTRFEPKTDENEGSNM